MAQTYGGGGGGGGGYFSGGTGSNPLIQKSIAAQPKPKKKPSTYYSSGTATKPAPYTQPYKAPKSSGGGGRSSGSGYSSGGGGGSSGSAYRSGKSVGSNSSGRIAKTAPAAKPPPPPMTADQIAKTFNQWSGGDLVYNQQKNALAQDWKDYQSRFQKEGIDYGLQNAANRKALIADRDKSRIDVLNDYGARGMLGDALNQGLSEFDTDWGKRVTDFDTAFTDWTNQQNQSKQDYQRTNELGLTKAQQDAIARRVASYGL